MLFTAYLSLIMYLLGQVGEWASVLIELWNSGLEALWKHGKQKRILLICRVICNSGGWGQSGSHSSLTRMRLLFQESQE